MPMSSRKICYNPISQAEVLVNSYNMNTQADEGLKGRQASWAIATSSLQKFSLVWLLSNEMLSYIFELGALSQEKGGISPWHYSFRDVYSFQLSVSHVSRHFRNVAVSTPRLWTIIHPLGPLERQVGYIKMCLERSGSLPCTISLNYEADIFYEYPNLIIDKIMAHVSSNIYRLERFFAKFCQTQILDQIMDYLNKPAPLLTALELTHTIHHASEHDPASDRHGPGPLLFDGQMPALATLLLVDVYASRRPSYTFKNLTVLGLMYQETGWPGPCQEYRTILENSPSLRKLILQGSMLAPLSLTEDDSPIKLELLEHLEMAFLTPEAAIDIIRSIDAPNLKTLTLGMMNFSDNVIVFDAIIEPPQSFPNLTSLVLAEFQTSEEALAKILHAYPNLESLGLYRNFTEKARWMHVLGGSRLCPNLKTLRCVNVDLEEIQDALARRAEANIPLPRLQLSDSLLEPGDICHNPSTLSWLLNQQNTQVEFSDLTLHYYC